tara:strand:+ start:1132 stop:2016 length:885 start_codon:yes stop_codon:yes gene_type:complete
MKTAIVSGCNDKYFYYLFNLYNSLRATKNFEKYDFCIFNVNIKEENLKLLEGSNIKIIEPKWDFKFDFKADDWKKLLTVRPFIKEYFKGYDNYIWLDADVWVQDDNFINEFNETSKLNKISIIPELDINYEVNKKNHSFKKIFSNIYKAKGWNYKNYKKYFNKDLAERLIQKPLFNAGVFSISSKSKVWGLWAEEFDRVISVSKNDYCLNMDQASLNKIIYENLNDVNFFSSKYNYLCKNKMPFYDKKKNYFCLPDYPFEKINIIHLTQISPYDIFDIRTTTGEVIKKKIIYEQ